MNEAQQKGRILLFGSAMNQRAIELKLRNYGIRSESMQEQPEATETIKTAIDTTASTPNPLNTENESARRVKRRNLSEDIRAAQKEVDGYERRIIPLRLALKNSQRRLARLLKKQNG